jgi:hypothetical protein
MNQPRCQPGNLAIVVESYNLENLGRIVKVLKPHKPVGPLAMHDLEPIWDIESDSLMVWSVGEKIIKQRSGPCPDSQLQPIRGRKLNRSRVDQALTA